MPFMVSPSIKKESTTRRNEQNTQPKKYSSESPHKASQKTENSTSDVKKEKEEGATNVGRKKNALQTFPTVVPRKVSLLLTEPERQTTTETMYFDYNTRISYHPPWIRNRFLIDSFSKHLFQHLTRGKRVLFVGYTSGLGLLPMMCARQGASRVVVMDESNIVPLCRTIASQNGFGENKLCFLQHSVRQIVNCRSSSDIPTVLQREPKSKKVKFAQFDFIFVDWISNFLCNNRAAVEELVAARTFFLAPNGELMPRTSSLDVVGVSDYEYHFNTIEWWSNVYGFRMNSMKNGIQKEPITGSVPSNTIATRLERVLTVRACDMTPEKTAINTFFTLHMNRPNNTILHYLTFCCEIEYRTKGGAGFSLKGDPAKERSEILPISLALPTFIPLEKEENVRFQFSMQTHPDLSVMPSRARISLTAESKENKSKIAFKHEYVYADYH